VRRRNERSSEQSTRITDQALSAYQAVHLSGITSTYRFLNEIIRLIVSFGVVKAFLDADLLPRVVTGTSAGGLVAALLCTRTDAELKHLLVPELANRITACEDAFGVWIKRWYETGARFSSIKWAEKVCFASSFDVNR
jgi:hypothetical protein